MACLEGELVIVPTEILTGTCQCGAVRYKIDGTIHRLNVCHCPDCQKQSGSAFGMSLVIEPAAFHLEAGVPTEFVTTAASGREKTCVFCPACGVRLYNRTSRLMSVKAGTLDDTSWLRPDAHYWTSRRQAWVPLSRDVPSHDESGD
jgi:hypothetical protein